MALVSLKPWETTSLAPNLAVSPGLGLALGGSVEVAPVRTPGIAEARLAGGTSSASVAESVAVSEPSQGDPRPLPAVSRGRAVGPSGLAPAPSEPPPSTPPATQPVAAPPESPPAAPPLLAGVESGASGSSGTTSSAGEVDPSQSCEGDEYTVTVTLDDGETASELSPVRVLIQRLGSAGSESELQLEGNLGDVRDLVDLLASEGNCVQVEFAPLGAGDPVSEDPESDTEAAGTGDKLEPVSR